MIEALNDGRINIIGQLQVGSKSFITNAKAFPKSYSLIAESADINDAVIEAERYIKGETKDRSGVIKFNKYLKMFGVKPITGKEISTTTVQSKYKELKAKRKYIF
jgi:hypothetical protein